MIINDWTGNSKRNRNNNIDAYKAIIKGNKLIIPAENNKHLSPYCEIEILAGNQLNKICCVPYNVSDFFSYVVSSICEITDEDYEFEEDLGNPNEKGSEI